MVDALLVGVMDLLSHSLGVTLLRKRAQSQEECVDLLKALEFSFKKRSLLSLSARLTPSVTGQAWDDIPLKTWRMLCSDAVNNTYLRHKAVTTFTRSIGTALVFASKGGHVC